MDDTQPSRASDAAATRKRRSSILKSQRPARTPFSELEFNVATPTDTAKSRRVSFSRKTGVAEFVTNEATTTWKNFYEEHNKSLESSSNDSEANASRQPVGHLGKRIFDQQFEEVEAVDFIGSLNPALSNGSLNNVNFTQQLASLECTADGKLTAPHNKFELSAFTDQHSKIFCNDFTAPSLGENSGRIDVNFSAIQQIGEKDDLDEIQRDLERGASMGRQGPFTGENMSEYIEVDLNMTHVAVKNDEDMSITDTIHSPVQDVSRSTSLGKKVSLNNDWVADKENIAINPYAAPAETNFAINDEPDQVLVFDGKRVTLQPDVPETDKNYRQTLLPNSSGETPQRKTIVLNVNDDLPNFVDDKLNFKCENSNFSGFQELKAVEDEISMTLPVNKVDIIPIRKSIVDNTGNISMTQALPTNIICDTSVRSKESSTKRRTIVFNESAGNISVTQALPVKLLCNNDDTAERRRTAVYENNTGNISITQAVSSNILVGENVESKDKRKTIVFDEEQGDISVTQALSSNIILDEKPVNKRKTIVFNDDACNVSITQALPANIILPDKKIQENHRTIIYEDDTGDIAVTQALPLNFIIPKNDTVPENKRTVVYEDDTGNISVTQALQSNIIVGRMELGENVMEPNKFPITDSLPSTISTTDSDEFRRRTIVYEDDTGNISITQAIPSQLIAECKDKSTIVSASNISPRKPHTQRRTTIVYDNDDNDVSMTEAISANIIDQAKRETIRLDDDDADISKALAISTNMFLLDKLDSQVDRSLKTQEEIKEEVYDKVSDYVICGKDDPAANSLKDDQKEAPINEEKIDVDMSITEAIPKVQNLIQETKRKTLIFDNDNGNISITKPIPAELLTFENDVLNRSKNKTNVVEKEEITNPCPEVIVYQATTANSEQANISEQPVMTEKDEEEEEGDLENKESMNFDSKISSPVKHAEKETASLKVSDDVEVLAPSEIDSVNISLIHPRVDERKEQLNLIATSDEEIENVADVIAIGTSTEIEEVIEKKDDSVLESLLDMSSTSEGSGIEDKNIMAQVESVQTIESKKKVSDNISSESMFYITQDCEEDTQTDQEDTKANVVVKPLLPPLALKDDPDQVDNLQKKLEELKSADNNMSTNRFYQQIVSSDLEGVVERDGNVKSRQPSFSFQRANDTKELLDMISDFTDHKEDENEPVIRAKKENKTDVEPKRISLAPQRQSIALSREDLLNNISMAQAVLQKSRLVLDDTDCLEDDTRDTIDQNLSAKQTSRLSNEVVKTLNFDDESISEPSFKSDFKFSPLKKTAFGETSYMTESKSKVIPTYLKDVSDGIKELMLDLVKPMADNLPFESARVDKAVRSSPSTHSTQIQANLVTSSQVDLETEWFNNESNYDDDKHSSRTSALHKSKSRPVRNPVQFSVPSEKSSLLEVPASKQRYIISEHEEHPSTEPVIVFDHLNPLNNILLGSMNYSDAHKYNPKNSESNHDDANNSGRVDKKSKEKKYQIDNMTTQYRVESSGLGELCVYKQEEKPYVYSSPSRPLSIDRSNDTLAMDIRDNEVNTLIAMKGNEELLEASSSLTLVDDAVEDQNENAEYQTALNNQNSHFIMEVTHDEISPETSIHNELIEHSKVCTKGKKRVYSPSTNKYKLYQSSLEVTPKQTTKMQKISNSPTVYKVAVLEEPYMAPEKHITDTKVYSANTSKTYVKKSSKVIKNSNMSVEQMITDHQLQSTTQNTIAKQILESLANSASSTDPFSQSEVLDCNSLEIVSSFTSSKNLNAMRDVYSESSTDRGDRGKPMEWQPELISAASSNLSDTDWSVNVVSKIDMLPFMGSHECEWESSSGDTWSFRLLHGRLRLTVRLAHRHDNAARTRVRGDTPVQDIFVDILQHDKKNPVATLCVRFACETMRHIVSRACRTTCYATDIPSLLKRCAAVARVALRWGRAMHDAKLHLAYNMDSDGNLTLKVANIPLRSVWEVSMRVQLVVDESREAACPRAEHVRVSRVVSDVIVSDLDVRRALANTPRDWGHAPRTIWRMFRYLKHKTRDDDLLA